MFSRVLNTAKRILSRSPSAQGRSSEPREATPRSHEADPDLEMVTTRRGTGTGPSVESTPRSSARKTRGKRELDVEETPTASKRRRKSVDKKKVQDEVEDSQEPTEEPAKESSADASNPIEASAIEDDGDESTDKKLPIRRRGSPEVIVSQTQTSPAEVEQTPAGTGDVPSSVPDAEFQTPDQIASSVYATPATRMKHNDSPTPRASKAQVEDPTPVSAKTSARRGRRSKKAVEEAALESPAPASTFPDEIPSSTWETENDITLTQDSAPAVTPKLKEVHQRFGSEEPTESIHTVPEPAAPSVEEEDSDDDSDEAPEVVTTAAAVSKAKTAAEEASRARKAQQEKQQRKQQERLDRVAEEQTEKRKRDEKKAKKLAKQQARLANSEPTRASLDVDINNLPALLPDSILEAAGDQRPPTPPRVRPGKSAEEIRKEKLNHHIKFLERGEQPVKDVKKGSLNVSVLRQQSMLLPPKVNKNTKNIREHWLKGREVEKRYKNGKRKMELRKAERKTTGGGFLRNRDD